LLNLGTGKAGLSLFSPQLSLIQIALTFSTDESTAELLRAALEELT
jgi:hypothetical protein